LRTIAILWYNFIKKERIKVETLQINKYALLGVLRQRQVQTARKIGVHPDTLAKKLTDPEELTVKQLNAIARACDVSLDVFVSIHRAISC
jgi:CTP synthase (UTP-ammonia lyase)